MRLFSRVALKMSFDTKNIDFETLQIQQGKTSLEDLAAPTQNFRCAYFITVHCGLFNLQRPKFDFNWNFLFFINISVPVPANIEMVKLTLT